jgi:16S rRNA C967 or C1407 C5-methylase (RsmB/RsmF family)
VQEKEQRRFAAWNIGNEDAEGFRVQWLNTDAKPVGKEILLPTLRPQAQSLLDIPEGAKALRLMNPPGTSNIYSNGLYTVQD